MSDTLVQTFTDSRGTEYTTVINKEDSGDILLMEVVKSVNGESNVHQITLNKGMRAKIDYLISDEFTK